MKNIPQQKLGTRYAWAVVGMLWMVCFLNYADRQAITAIFPVLEKQFGFSKFQLGMIGSIFMWIYAAGAFFAGFVSDRVWRKPLILGGCLFWSAVTACTGFCSKLWQFLAVRALEGMGEAFYFPSSNSLIADYHPKKNRSTALACHQTGVYLGTIAGSSFGAWLAEHYGWQYGFYFFGSVGVVVSVILFFFLKEPRRHVEEEYEISEVLEASSTGLGALFAASVDCEDRFLGIVKTLHALVRRPALVLLVLAFICVNFVAWIFLTWMPTFLYEKFHMTLTMAGCSAVIFIQLASTLSAPCWGRMADWLAQRQHHGRVMLQTLCLLLGIATIVVVGAANNMQLLIAAMIAFGVCKGGYDAGIFPVLFDYIDPKLRGAGCGLLISCGYFGGALGPTLVGAISTYGGASSSAMRRMSTTISMSAAAYGIGALLLVGVLFVVPKKGKK